MDVNPGCLKALADPLSVGEALLQGKDQAAVIPDAEI
jgi:hypothetical protein